MTTKTPDRALWEFAHGTVEFTDDEPEILEQIGMNTLYPPRNCYGDIRTMIADYRREGSELLRWKAQSAADLALRHQHISAIQYIQLVEILEGADLPQEE